jgi:amino acid adenylation domain-containing protein
MSDITDRIARLSPAKQALLELRLKENSAKDAAGETIPCRTQSGAVPLSFAQQRLWFLDQLEPNSPLYNVCRALRLSGILDPEALEKSIAAVVERHEALRTTFRSGNGEPVQVVETNPRVQLPTIDLSVLPDNDRDPELQRLLQQEALRPFDLAAGLMLRPTLFRLAEQEHVILLVMHHISSDGWSMGVLYHEISILYEAFSGGKPSPLSELPIQYADFAVWQRQWFQGEVLESQLSYWSKQLEESPGILNLPTDHPRPAVQSYRGGWRSLEVSKERTQELKALSRKEGVTLFMTLLAAFQTLLYRYTGQEDLVVGSPIANRTRQEIEGLIGFFVNTLVFRSDFSGNPTFRELLAKVRETALGAYAHQDLPFEKLVEELHPERSLSHSPLIQVMFVFQNAPNALPRFEGLSVSPVQVSAETAKFELALFVQESAQGLSASLHYKTDLFEQATIDRMLRHLETLLESIVANPDARISSLPLLTQAEMHKVSLKWNETRRDYPSDKCIQELFEAEAEKSPDAVAVIFDAEQLIYRELNGRANQLAHHLRSLGVGPETPVGICMERSLEMVVALLAILKSGGAYVPLDPMNPKDRLAFMLEDTQAQVVISQTRLAAILPDSRVRVVYLDRDADAIARESGENPIGDTTAESVAYVMYTSGSSGQPKGVAVPHRGVLRLLSGVEYVRLDAQKTFLHLAPTSFDASTFEIWGALLHGAKCVLFPGRIPAPNEIGEILHHHKITTLWLTASLFNTVMDEAPAALSGVSQLLVGGEALSVPHVRRALAELPATQIVNGYGPTESTTFTCCYPIPARLDESVSTIPIGRPIANTEVYLLDSYGSPVPVGIAGELYVGGDGLARGYLNRPELTAQKFVPHPFTNRAGARLYKTGDLARYLPDGNIEFLGRIDDQVKIRGFRIEPGEIEVVLTGHTAVREAVVVAREDNSGDKRLAAYVIAGRSPAPSVSDLCAYLKAKLPEYMVPSAFVFLDGLPLTANGKLNRRALPAPDRSRPEFERNFVAPRTPVEEIIAEIWTEILKLEEIGVHDNFFELGGHSLLATQAVSRLRQALQIELPLRVLFEKPTVSALAEHIEESRRRDERRVDPPPVILVSREEYVPLSFAQQRLWFLDQLEPGSTAYNLSGAFRLRGPLIAAALEQSVSEIIRRHESLRTTFSSMDGKPVQVISPSLAAPLLVIDLTNRMEGDREGEARRLLAEEARRPFDLACGPLFRAALIRLGEDDHVLVLAMHHIVSDGWSMGVLYRELAILYQAFSAGDPSPLPDLPEQYADFAVWQRGWLQGEFLQSQISYWKKQLEGIPAVLSLPTDRPRQAARSARAARQALNLSKELAQGLKDLSRQQGATLFMTLLAAFQTLLCRYTGQEDIVVGSPIANRNRTEIEGLIGFFVNTLVLRANFSGNPTFKELLYRVKDMALDAYAHQDLSFEKLVEEIHPERSLNHTPLFQVLFNMVNEEDGKVEIPGLTVERLASLSSESKFDMTLYAKQQDDQITFNLVYRADLFDDARMRCFLQQYRYLLEQIVAAPQKPIRLHSLVTAESRALLPDPSATLTEPAQSPVTGAFLAWARQTPGHPAITQGQQSWSYSELARCANTLAQLLVADGLAQREVVVVYGKPSFGLIAATIATLLSGGVLLLVDQTLPMQRKQRMLAEAKAKKLLYVGAKQADDAWLEEDFDAGILFIDPENGCAVAPESPGSIPLPEMDGNDPAYIFFTSGSTGVPKGVSGCHKGLSHFLGWQRESFAIGPGDRVAQLTGLSFDAVLRDIFLPLTSGATLCLRDVDDSPADTLEWLDRQRITVFHAVPSLAQSWLSSGDAKVHLKNMRWVFFVGEPLTEALVCQWRGAVSNAAAIVNLYGPTETTLVKCFYRVPADIHPGVQPLGGPIPNTQALVFTENNQLCGINEPGEIVLRTPFRSLGYINAPEENHKRFVKNPFSHDAEDLLYFTGDAACYRPDGTLQILGRLDDEVKIRGVRIEPAEVAATLARHPLVKSCAVVGRKNDRQETYLAAYAVPSGEEKLTPAELRSYLLEQLPPAMVPSVFVFIDSLPLTPTGKIDRKALPEPDHQRSRPEDSYIAPRTEIEHVLAGIWAEVLQLQRVGVSDDFFELGGHSLLATQIVSRIREALQVDLALRTLFEKPTVAGLAGHLESIRRAGQQDDLTSTDDSDETEELTL